MVDFHRHFSPDYRILPYHPHLTIWWATTDTDEYPIYENETNSYHGYGLLPVTKLSTEALFQLKSRLSQDPLSYISEVGVDTKFDDTMTQKELTSEIVKLAISHHCPIVFHLNYSIEKMKPHFLFVKKRVPMIVHHFTGSIETARELYSLGVYISIGPRIWQKKMKLATRINELTIPILLETDYTGNDEDEYEKVLGEHYHWFATQTQKSVEKVVERQYELSSLFQNHSFNR
jgi:Tat protein secretion system quality control protein TatD with DNase activity